MEEKKKNSLTNCWFYSFEIRPGLAGRTETRPTQDLEPGRIEEKIEEEKTRLTRQDPIKNPVATR
jgi:hypothetical protein